MPFPSTKQFVNPTWRWLIKAFEPILVLLRRLHQPALYFVDHLRLIDLKILSCKVDSESLKWMDTLHMFGRVWCAVWREPLWHLDSWLVLQRISLLCITFRLITELWDIILILISTMKWRIYIRYFRIQPTSAATVKLVTQLVRLTSFPM